MSQKAVPIGIRVSPDMASWLKRQAESNHRSVSNQTVLLLAQARQQLDARQCQGAQS